MADINKIIPFILQYESGCIKKSTETLEAYFERCKTKGFANDPLDRGGATQCGITILAYQRYCKDYHIVQNTVADLKKISLERWRNILKVYYWDKMGGDKINSQGIANIIVDWAWASGNVTAAKKVQTIVGAIADGIIGAKTIAAINSKPPITLFTTIKKKRIEFVEAIVARNPSQKKWLKGWKNRINAIEYVE